MADDPKPAETAKAVQNVRLMRSKDFRVSFSNTFRIRTNGYDVGVTFGYQTEIPSGPVDAAQSQVVIIDEVEVVMTPVALKLFHLALSHNLEAIEAATGKQIELPQAMLDSLMAQKSRIFADLKAEIAATSGTSAKSD